ncbi:MAG: DM13 domain-containing protein [Candidatus Peribacteraceae bacterium]|nr:DM13 domain-containing protein [Candidatus Peribacteraceae bacterium]
MHTALKRLCILFVVPALLAGCSATRPTLNDHLNNPLFAERYAEELVNRMTELEIQKDPLIEDVEKKAIIDQVREQWMERAKKARDVQREGMTGEFAEMKEYVRGRALLLGKTVYLSTTFESEPGPSLHFYLTTMVDPRDVAFPDPTAVDLGLLQSPYGAQTIAVPEAKDSSLYRTLVLWDASLERLYGFAQLSR